jgi:hypothetical protein
MQLTWRHRSLEQSVGCQGCRHGDAGNAHHADQRHEAASRPAGGASLPRRVERRPRARRGSCRPARSHSLRHREATASLARRSPAHGTTIRSLAALQHNSDAARACPGEAARPCMRDGWLGMRFAQAALGTGVGRAASGHGKRRHALPYLRARPHPAGPLADLRQAARAVARQPVQPAGAHLAGPQDRRLVRGVRGCHPPLRQTRVAPPRDQHPRHARAGARGDRAHQAVLRSPALRSRREGVRQALRPQGAAGGAHVRPLRHAAARHRPGNDPGAQPLHHRLARRARHPAGVRPLRPRRLHRPRHRDDPLRRHQHARDRGLPALRAGAGRGRGHGGAGRSLPPGLAHADGRADRHAAQPDPWSTSTPRSAASTGSSAT